VNNNYGKLFLLFASIGIIMLATSGKGLAVWEVLTGKTNTSTPRQPTINDYDNAGSGSGGVMS